MKRWILNYKVVKFKALFPIVNVLKLNFTILNRIAKFVRQQLL